MQTFLTDLELKNLAPNLEKKECIRSLLWHLNVIEGNGMQYVLDNPEFQVTWRKACKLFHFYDGDKGKCSASNIESFRDMVKKEYPDIYKELSDIGEKAIRSIQISALTRSRDILKKWDTESICVGPIELMEGIWVNGFGEYTPQTKALFDLLENGENIEGYLSHFYQYLVTHFVKGEDVWKLLRHEEGAGFDKKNITQYLDTPTILILLGRMESWNELYNHGHSKIPFEKLVESAPKEFLELIRTRRNKKDAEEVIAPIRRMILDITAIEDSIWWVLDLLEGMNAITIKFILAHRFPQKYLDFLEKTTSGEEIFLELRLRDMDAKNKESILEVFIQSGLKTKVLDLLSHRMGDKMWDIGDDILWPITN